MEIVKRLYEYLLDLILPKKCIGCNRKDLFLCEDCFSLIELNPNIYCPCDNLVKNYHCYQCSNTSLDRLYSATDYNDTIIKKLIKEAKHIKRLTSYEAIMILMHLNEVGFSFENDMLMIPTPLSKKEERQQGFNVAKEIIEIIHTEISIPYSFDNLIIKNDNLKIVNQEIIKGKKILLINEVYEVNGTINKCAELLKNNKAEEVYGITLARKINKVDRKGFFV